jgi:hypothetical protein
VDGQYNAYAWAKEYWGGQFEPYAVRLYRVGSSNLVSGNLITNAVGGVGLYGVSNNPFQYTVVNSNVFGNLSGPAFYANQSDLTFIHDNLATNTTETVRFNSLNATRTGSNRAYVYRNRSWNPPGFGWWSYMHGDLIGSFLSEIWCYHNSYEGGFAAITVSSYLTAVTAKFRWINNIFSTARGVTHPQYSPDSTFDFNRTLPLSTSTWYGTQNQINPLYEWGGASAATTPPDFQLDTGSLAISHGLPVHQTFTLNSVSYPALPGFSTVYYSGSSADIGAIPYNFEEGLPPEPGVITNVLSISSGPPAPLRMRENIVRPIAEEEKWNSSSASLRAA